MLEFVRQNWHTPSETKFHYIIVPCHCKEVLTVLLDLFNLGRVSVYESLLYRYMGLLCLSFPSYS